MFEILFYVSSSNCMGKSKFHVFTENLKIYQRLRLFNIFWDFQNLPLISLAIDCNRYKTRK